MPLTWHRLHRQLLDTTLRKSFEIDFAEVLAADPVFARFIDLSGMLAALHGPERSHDEGKRILAALIVTAQGPEGRSADIAVTALLLALWPGLSAVHNRLRLQCQRDLEELPSEILLQATKRLRQVNLGRVTQVAATLLRNVQRDVTRARMRQDRPLELPDQPETLSPEDQLLARQITARLGRDAPLVIAVAVDGMARQEAGAGLGLSNEAAWKRYARAIKRAREWG